MLRITNGLFRVNGYQQFPIPRAKGCGGGVGVLYKSSLKLISVKPIHHQGVHFSFKANHLVG